MDSRRDAEGTPRIDCSLCALPSDYGRLLMLCGHAYHSACLAKLRAMSSGCADGSCGGSIARASDVQEDIGPLYVHPYGHYHYEMEMSEEQESDALFLREFFRVVDLEDECASIDSLSRRQLKHQLSTSLPTRVTLPEYLAEVPFVQPTFNARVYSSLLAFVAVGEMQLSFYDVFGCRVVRAETAFFAETIGCAPMTRQEAVESGVVFIANQGEERELHELLLSSMQALQFDTKRLFDPRVSIMIVTLDGVHAAGLRLFQCRCRSFISNSLLLCRAHYHECLFRGHSVTGSQAELLPRISHSMSTRFPDPVDVPEQWFFD